MNARSTPGRPRSSSWYLRCAALVLVAFGAAVLLFELLALQCNCDDISVRCSLIPTADDVDELGLQAHETIEELAAADDKAAAGARLRSERHSSNISNDARNEVALADLLHLSLLQTACLEHKDSAIPWTVGEPGPDQTNVSRVDALVLRKNDSNVVEWLRQCPDVDVYLPEGLRGHGYCEDAVAYAKCTSSMPRAVDR